MRAVITVIGKDTVGIIAKVSNKCFEYNVNILDITQKVFDGTFAMIMMADITGLNIKFNDFVDKMAELGNTIGMSVITMHEDIFNAMHKI